MLGSAIAINLSSCITRVRLTVEFEVYHLSLHTVARYYYILSTLFQRVLMTPLGISPAGNVPVVIVSSPDIAREFLKVKTHKLTFSSRKHSLVMERMTYNSGFELAPYGPFW